MNIKKNTRYPEFPFHYKSKLYGENHSAKPSDELCSSDGFAED
jgi:hypothetical protein